jgi:hypothetical protein
LGRYECSGLIDTSDKPFSACGQIFGDGPLVTALAAG